MACFTMQNEAFHSIRSRISPTNMMYFAWQNEAFQKTIQKEQQKKEIENNN